MDVQVNKIRFNYGNNEILKDISVTFPSTNLSVILGPSGCGKTTLLRCIAGLEKLKGGTISFRNDNGEESQLKQLTISMVFQDLALYQSLSVEENITIALKSHKEKKESIKSKLAEVSELLDIKKILSKPISKISGGEKQRVAIARSLIRYPDILLLDEPFANLDANIKSQIRLKLKDIIRAKKLTTIMVTHDQSDAFELSDYMVVMNEGLVQQDGGSVDIYTRPQNTFVANFLGNPKINIFSQEKIESLSLTNNLSKTIGIRPENIEIGEVDSSPQYIKVLGRLVDIIPYMPLYNYVFETSIGRINVLKEYRAINIGDYYDLHLNTKSFLSFST